MENRKVISDYGPQFASCDFAQFAETYGFGHSTSSPRHTQGNDEAKRTSGPNNQETVEEIS